MLLLKSFKRVSTYDERKGESTSLSQNTRYKCTVFVLSESMIDSVSSLSLSNLVWLDDDSRLSVILPRWIVCLGYAWNETVCVKIHVPLVLQGRRRHCLRGHRYIFPFRMSYYLLHTVRSLNFCCCFFTKTHIDSPTTDPREIAFSAYCSMISTVRQWNNAYNDLRITFDSEYIVSSKMIRVRVGEETRSSYCHSHEQRPELW